MIRKQNTNHLFGRREVIENRIQSGLNMWKEKHLDLVVRTEAGELGDLVSNPGSGTAAV